MMPVFSPRWIFLCVGFGHFLRSRRMQRLPMVFLCVNWEGLDKHGKKLCFFTSNPVFFGFVWNNHFNRWPGLLVRMSISKMAYWKAVDFGSTHGEFQTRSSGLVRLPSNTAGQSFQDGGKTWQNCKCYLKFCAMCDLCHGSARIGQVSIPHRWTQPLGPRVGCSQETSINLNQLEPTWINWTPDWPGICWPQIEPMTNQWNPLTTGPVPSASAWGCCRGGSMPLGGYWEPQNGFKFDPKIS